MKYYRTLFIMIMMLITLTASSQPDPMNGWQVKWKFQTGGAIRGTACIDKDVLYTGSADTYLYAIDKSGKSLWKFKTGGAIHCRPVVHNGIIYFTSRDQYLYAVNASTGKLKWKFQTGALLPHAWGWEYFLSSPAIADNKVYFGSAEGLIYAVDEASGKVVWTCKTNGRVRSTPTISDNTIYCGSYDGYMYALNSKTGEIKWKFETDGVHLNSDSSGWDRISIDSKPVMAGEIMVFGSRDGNVYALNKETGDVKWKFTHGPTWAVSSPSVSDNTVFIGWSDNFLFSAIDLQTGKEKWNYKAGYYIYTSPLIINKAVFTGSHDGNLYCFDKETGRKNWQYRTEGAILSSPVYDEANIYVGSDDGNLYAFENTGKPPVMKAVFAPRDPLYQSWMVDQRFPGYLFINGFEMLDSAKVSQFMQERIKDGRPSVIVFVPSLLPQKMIEENGKQPMIRKYMDNGGRVIWLGSIPNLYQYDTSGNFIGEDPGVAQKILDIEFDITHDAGWYNCKATPEGKKWGLPDWYVGSFSVKKQNGIVPLAINEYGRPSVWYKKFGNKGGMFIQARVWPQDKGTKDIHLEIVKKLAEFGF
jgi:outer membrane protein assembly factor BamB